jgi:hypothetical protein
MPRLGRNPEQGAETVNIETAAKTIQVILAPVVMVTACGLLLTGMLAHYTAINARIRALAGERLRLALVTPAAGDEVFARERLTQIDHQVPMLVRRHRLVHHVILLANSAVVILILSMFVIGAAALADSDAIGTAALCVFLTGTGCLLASAGFMAVEVRISNSSVAYEATRITALPITWWQPDDPPVVLEVDQSDEGPR